MQEVTKIKNKEGKMYKIIKEDLRKKFQQYLETIKENYDQKDGISHEKACIVLSCEFGIKELKKICFRDKGLDFGVLSETYHKLEKIFFKKNLYPSPRIKCALVIYLKYDISKKEACILSNCTISALRNYLFLLKECIRTKQKLSYNPEPDIDLSELFHEPETYLLEINCPLCSNIYNCILKKIGYTLVLDEKNCPYCNTDNTPSFYYLKKLKEMIKRYRKS